jgi:hypothetical protein
MYLGVLDASGFLSPLSISIPLLEGKKEMVIRSTKKKIVVQK